MANATFEELDETVRRMERRLCQSDSADIRYLWHHYQTLVARFEQDLSGSKRDVALAKASALMVLQSVQQEGLEKR